MKRAFMSETAIVRTLAPSIAGVGLFIFVVLTLANATDGDSGMSAGACAVSAMSPIIIMNSLAGYDNQNGWERYRATLPFSRKDIICARYLCIVVFSIVMACAATLLNILALPLFDPMGIPSTCQTIFEIATASAASMLISLMMVFLAQPLLGLRTISWTATRPFPARRGTRPACGRRAHRCASPYCIGRSSPRAPR